MNDDIQNFIASCEICKQYQNSNNPNSTLSKVLTFLLFVDQKSKWLLVILMKSGTEASETVFVLKNIFAVYGLPFEHVSDGSPPFNSDEFVSFLRMVSNL